MRKVQSQFALTVGLTLVVLAHTASAGSVSIRNAGFEAGKPGELPVGWGDLSASQYGATVQLSSEAPHSGRSCVEIRHDPSPRTGQVGQVYLTQTVSALPYRGHRLELSGWLRCKPPGQVPWPVSVHLWMQTDGSPDGYADLGNSPVRSSSWTFAETACEVPSDADSIFVGAYLDIAGRASIDDLRLTDCGVIGVGDDTSARPASARGLDNLRAFARLLGYVRHFHPSDQAAATNWDTFAIAGVDAIETSRTDTELAQRLLRLFQPIAPTVRVATHALLPIDHRRLGADDREAHHITSWVHNGWPWGTPQPFYTERRVIAPIDAPGDSVLPLGTEVRVQLGPHLWAAVPLTLCRSSQGTLPRLGANPTILPLRRPRGWVPTARDRATRLAGVILFWNIAQHFYPNFDLAGTDWPAALGPALKSAAIDSDAASYAATLRKLTANLADGHAAVTVPHSPADPIRPVAWDFVQQHLIVTQVDSTRAEGIQLGDEVMALQGRAVAEWVRLANEQWRAASPQRTQLIVARAISTMCGPDSLMLDLRATNGVLRRVRIASGGPVHLAPARPDSICELRPGLYYVDIARVTDASLVSVLPRIASARGAIFDFRGYPNRLRHYVAAHLIDSTVVSELDRTPIIRRPDQMVTSYRTDSVLVAPRLPRISSRVVFLTDARAQSLSEWMLGAIASDTLGAIVGEPTSGSSGNVTWVKLPGRFVITFSGTRAERADGSRLVGIGIMPTIPVSRTIQGVAAGRDEQLERAIALFAH